MAPPAPTPLPRLLLDLHRERFTGGLRLHRGSVTRRVEWREGAPVRLESPLPEEAPGALLVGRGLLAEADLEKARREAGRRGTGELAAIAGLKLVPARDLLLALRGQLHALLVEASGWADVGVDVQPGEAAGPALPVPPLDVVGLVIEAVGRHWSLATLTAALGRRAETYLAAGPDAGSWRRRLGGAEVATPLLAALDGGRRGAEIAEQLSDPRCRAGLFVLHALGALESREAPAEPEAEEATGAAAEPELEVVVAGRDDASGPARAAEAKHESAGGAEEETLDARAAALRDEILDLHGRLDALDYYALLGVEKDSDPGAVKKAYLKAAKRLHPDRMARMGLEGYKEQANAVFARVTEAHTVLSDPEQRRRYDDGGEDDGEAGRLAQAETLFLKAEILMRAGSFLDAHELLERVVALWPDEAAYQAALAWTLFKKTPPELERALDTFEKALGLDGSDAVAWLRLGIVRKQTGDAEGAKEATERGRRLDPDAKP